MRVKGSYKFSIIIPTRNHSYFLEKTLTRIKKLDYDFNNIQLIVVDNKSVDSTKQVVLDFISKNPNIDILYLFEKKIGPSYARNKGIQNSKYLYVVCIDDDVLIERSLLMRYVKTLKSEPDVAAIGGKIIAISPFKKKFFYYLRVLGNSNCWVFSQTMRKEKKPTILKYPDYLYSAVLLINRVIVKGKVFNTKFGKNYFGLMLFAEDLELCNRLLLLKKKVIYDPSIVVKHIISEKKLNFSYVFSRFFRSGLEFRLLKSEFGDVEGGLAKFDLKSFLFVFMEYIKNPCIGDFIMLMRKVLFYIGYYFPLIIFR